MTFPPFKAKKQSILYAVQHKESFNMHKSASNRGSGIFENNIMANTAEIKIPEMTENFEDLLNEQFGGKGIVGTVMKGTIIRLTDDFATVDVGLKSEGRIPLREFGKTTN